MPVYVIDTLKPKNGLDFPVVEAVDVAVEGYASLAEAVTHFATDTAIAAINATLGTKADTSALNSATENLQAQIDQIVISASAESVVAPEVAQARVSADGTEYNTLKDRLNAQDKYTQDSIDIINSNFVDIEAAFGFSNFISINYTSNEVPQPDGTFFEDTGVTQHWFGSGYIEIPEGTKIIYYRGKSYADAQRETLITPLAFYDSSHNMISCVPATDYITVEGAIAVPNNAKYFYQTQFYTEGSERNSNNYTKLYYGEKYNLDYISQSAITTGVGATIFTASDYTSDAIYLADGTSRTFDNWYSTDFVDCSYRDTVTYDSYAYHDATIDVAYVAFFDENKNMVSCLKSSDTRDGEQIGTVDVPSDAKYVRSITASGITPKLQLNATGIYAEYNFDDIAYSKNAIGDDSVIYEASDYTSNAIYLTDGTSRAFDNWYSTEFIDCSSVSSVDYDSYAFFMSGIDVAYVAFFDETKTMISCLKSSDTSQGEKRGTVDVPTGAKYVRSIYAAATSMTPKLQLAATGMKKDISDLQKAESQNTPLTYSSKICCIGDSLTQGVDVRSHLIKENYPYFMSQYLNCTILNYGQMGRTSKTWWDNYKDYYTYDPTIDVVLIMFGTNGGLTQNTLPTDVEPYDDPEDYADTSVGCYCKLIEKIMTDTQNHAQIILLTPPYSTYTSQQEQTVINSEPTIRAIAKRYQLPVIDVLNESGMGKFNGAVFRPHDGCHFNAKGYHRLGTFLGSKVKSMISTFDVNEQYDDETPIGE